MTMTRPPCAGAARQPLDPGYFSRPGRGGWLPRRGDTRHADPGRLSARRAGGRIRRLHPARARPGPVPGRLPGRGCRGGRGPAGQHGRARAGALDHGPALRPQRAGHRGPVRRGAARPRPAARIGRGAGTARPPRPGPGRRGRPADQPCCSAWSARPPPSRRPCSAPGCWSSPWPRQRPGSTACWPWPTWFRGRDWMAGGSSERSRGRARAIPPAQVSPRPGSARSAARSWSPPGWPPWRWVT